MKDKIRKSIMLVAGVALLFSYIIMTFVIYQQTLAVLREELEQEALYIKTSLEISGDQYMGVLDDVQKTTRITWIDQDGTVLYDSGKDLDDTENHYNRKEVAEARKKGTGSDVRFSGTTGKQMYYYALQLDNGTILRVSKTIDSVVATAFQVFPWILISFAAMVLLAWIISGRQVKKIIVPINNLDLEHPLENKLYSEFTPLLERIDKQNKEKEENEQTRREFSANVSHELKTPLTSISGYAELMKNGMVRSEDVPQFSERIYEEASRMITLVGDIIHLSKLDEGATEMDKEEVDLYTLARDSISRISMEAQKRNIKLEIVGEKTLFFGVRSVLQEMIHNIVENAVKYNKDNGKVEVWVGNTIKGPKMVVSDTGIGISEEHHERIFERFYRVDKSHSRESGGTGLGLSIVKHAAILHDIQIQLQSEMGKGTRIELLFPQQ